MTTPANPTPEPDGKVPKRGDDVLIEGLAKEVRSLRKKNSKLKAENERLKMRLDGYDNSFKDL